MKSFIILTVLAPLVLCVVPNKSNSEPTPDRMKEIFELKALTDEYSRLNKTYINPLQSSIKVNKDDVSFYVYTQENNTGEEVFMNEAKNITLCSSFNTSLRTIFVIHGWDNTYNSSVDVLIEAVFLAYEDINVIAVNWDTVAGEIYTIAQAAVPFVGKYIGEFISDLSESYNYSLDNITLIGHSLGAHVAGFAGKELNGSLHSIIGLDPAGPLYFDLLRHLRLNEDDAQYVLAIHTCAKLLGVNYRVADADFWPNGGYSQVGCGTDITGSCAHSRSYMYFAESVQDSNFIARECDSYRKYTAGKCTENAKVTMGGAYINTTIYGNFYLETNSSYPFALGDTDL